MALAFERNPSRTTAPILMRSLLAALIALFVLVASPVLAREEIQSYTTNTTLRLDGSVDVVETIAVRSEFDQIRHGIYRDIPIILINDDKSRVRSDLNVISVLRDGDPEQFAVDNLDSGFKRIKIGSADVYLDAGRVYTYTIHYTMTRMARFFADHDELYWNATGNYWVFPILKVTATLNVPDAAIISDAVGYTGKPGSQEQAVDITRALSGHSAAFRTTRPLGAGEGLSVAVKFQKGVLLPSTGVGDWLSDHRDLVFPMLAALLVLAYNLFAWNAVGRDPQKGTIIPLFHPPKDMSPALVHYVSSMGFKKSGWTAFIASIFDLGVKGLVSIDKTGSKTTINATGATAIDLPVGEKEVYQFLHSRGSVTIDKTDGPQLNTKRGELVSALERENRQVYFRNNVAYTLGGVALSILLLGGLVLFDVLQPAALAIAVVAAIIIGILFSVLQGARSGGGIVGKLISGVWIAIVAVNIFGSGMSALAGLRIDTGLIAATSVVVIEIVFAILMRAPTLQGRKLMDQIEGFKMYLETAEKNRLNYVDKGEPQMTVKRFESILPFAIALAVEKPWSQRFEADLARNAVAGVTAGYSPLWYTGGNWSDSTSGISNTVSNMSSAMTAAMIAAQPSTSSGSGFSGGGGGGSGGGGGGGGGGGW